MRLWRADGHASTCCYTQSGAGPPAPEHNGSVVKHWPRGDALVAGDVAGGVWMWDLARPDTCTTSYQVSELLVWGLEL